MSKILVILLAVLLLAPKAGAVSFTAPQVEGDGAALMPEDQESFAEGLLSILQDVLPKLQPALSEALRYSLSFLAIAILISIIQSIQGCPQHVVQLVGTLTVAAMLLETSQSFIGLASETVKQISDYGKLLLPVMGSALAAQGGTGTSVALYTATAAFDALLGSIVSAVIIPIIYAYLCISTAYSAVGESLLGKIKDFLKWSATWILKIILYVFTGYITVTGVVSGSADASVLKATKLTISGAVPVVGGILSDASEAILVSASVAKNAAGLYGILAFVSICILPFLQIGSHYLILKLTGAVCSIFGSKQLVSLIKDFTTALGLLLSMTGTVCLLLMISTVCFMKGVT